MTAGWFGQSLGILAGVVVTFAVTQGTAEAARAKHQIQSSRNASATHAGFNRSYRHYSTRRSAAWSGGGLQCVPFARENSGIELSGNAGTWWGSAAGLYERGAHPEVGSVLNFRATGRMRMGHIAVVTNVITPRHIEIDHANWSAPGRISHDIDVVDVSPDNDWTEVRVALGHTEDYGSAYPTYGFIYDRPDHGTMLANTGAMPAPALNPAPVEVAAAAAMPEEVAEAPGDDDADPAPRSYSLHRASHAKWFTARTRERTVSSARATTYRVSSHGAAVGKPHRTTRRHF